MDINEIIRENGRRNAALDDHYDPERGIGCAGERVMTDVDGHTYNLPRAMLDDPQWMLARRNPAALTRLRLRYDFEFWAVRCAVVQDKLTGADIPFRLNRPQRKVLAVVEAQRTAGQPMRLIILKARQWGGSTFVQIYMAWIQTVLLTNRHSLICAHVKDTAATIRGMYSKLLGHYPKDLWEGDAAPAFKAFEGSQNTREIAGRGCRVTLASAENQDSCRGNDIAMAHLSEVAFWKDTRLRKPDELVRASVSGIALAPMTFIAMESTANGVGNYFHREWLRAEAGESDKAPVFVAWFEIEMYRLRVADPAALWASMDDYERGLWARGLTLEMIAWYHAKRREMPSDDRMHAEYPTDPVEAFSATGFGVFHPRLVEQLRPGCRPGATGEIAGDSPVGPSALLHTAFHPDPTGKLTLWEAPQPATDYITSVDIGGRSDAADWSVIAVIANRERPEVVAQWRGHTDHDLLAWKAAAIATFFNNALLVIESNTLETEAPAGEPYVLLDQLGWTYDRLYFRDGGRPGFHTNTATKAAMITRLVATVREAGYVERDARALDEMMTYEQLPGGGYAARSGCHDDILMTRAIALYVAAQNPAPQADERMPSACYCW